MTFSLNVERSNLQLQVQTSINSQIPPTFGYESVALPTKSQHHNDHLNVKMKATVMKRTKFLIEIVRIQNNESITVVKDLKYYDFPSYQEQGSMKYEQSVLLKNKESSPTR